MSSVWTTEQVLSLAPDASSAKSGKGLATLRHWVSCGQYESALWGECQGSGAKPYQVQIDLSEPAFKCSCPSRKFPCKHGIGLLLLSIAGDGSVPVAEPPAWMTEWLQSRQTRAEKKEAAKKPESERSPEERAKTAADQAKRTAAREKKVAQGLTELDLWLRDLVRQGFSGLPSRPYAFWDDQAARMVDAQASGVARRVRELGSIVAAGGANWQGELLERLGLLYLLIEGHGRLEALPEASQWDVREAIGYSLRQEELLGKPGVTDLWHVVGQRVFDDETLKVQRSYLWGVRSGRWAQVVHYAPLKAPAGAAPALDVSLVPGAAFEAELVFYPGGTPLRALVKERQPVQSPLGQPQGSVTIAQFLAHYAEALAGNPWLTVFPAPLTEVVPVRDPASGWHLRDSGSHCLPLAPDFTGGWQLLALSGGHPLPRLLSEWDGAALRPLSVVIGEHLLPL